MEIYNAVEEMDDEDEVSLIKSAWVILIFVCSTMHFCEITMC